MASSPLAADDLQPLLDEVSRFCSAEMALITIRPEMPASAEEISKLSQSAFEFGILPGDDQEPGVALWEQPDDVNAITFSIDALKQIASVNAGIALAWHRNALARFLARAIGFHLTEAQQAPLAVSAISTGHHGLARGSLARWLHQRASDCDQSMLADWLDRNTHKTTVTAPPQWQDLIWPVWHKGIMSWQLLNRREVAVAPCRPQHGLDELDTWQVSASPEAGAVIKATPQQVSSMLILDALGLLAIAAGINQHGEALARAFASLRRQGGRIINQHSAVQTMLATIQQAQWEAEMTLNGLTRPLPGLSLKDLLMARQQLHPKLCLAANLVMQVHGGIGYMQDCGPEKLLRDQNMLRLQSGGIREIPLFIHAWGRYR
tara:strand:+ start:1105 stop:2235 length:1131 start_codon:yes stop_codon:yes gene_type:complete